MSGSEVRSTLKPPPKKALQAFHVGADSVGDDLAKGWSLAIRCKARARRVEWTPPELARRFGDRPKLWIAAVAERLSCAGEAGCGSREIAVFPHA